MQQQTDLPLSLKRARRFRGAPRRVLREIWGARQAYVLLLPIFAVLGVFAYYPPLSALYHAFFDWAPTGASRFVGLDNFRAMLQDEVFRTSFANMLKLSAFTVIATITVPFVVAEMIFSVKSRAAQYLYRVWFLIPVVAPLIVVLLLWRFIYDPSVGLLNAALDAVGLSSLKRGWLGDFDTALVSLMFIGFPFVQGTNVLIYLAGLNNIPGEVREAAELDGATGLRRIRYIDLPLLAGQIRLFAVLGIITALQAFELPLILTRGGPGISTQVPGLVMYQNAFENAKFGYASAIGLVLFVLALVLTILTTRLLRSDSSDGAR